MMRGYRGALEAAVGRPVLTAAGVAVLAALASWPS